MKRTNERERRGGKGRRWGKRGEGRERGEGMRCKQKERESGARIMVFIEERWWWCSSKCVGKKKEMWNRNQGQGRKEGKDEPAFQADMTSPFQSEWTNSLPRKRAGGQD